MTLGKQGAYQMAADDPPTTGHDDSLRIQIVLLVSSCDSTQGAIEARRQRLSLGNRVY